MMLKTPCSLKSNGLSSSKSLCTSDNFGERGIVDALGFTNGITSGGSAAVVVAKLLLTDCVSSSNNRCFLACDGEGEAMSALDGGIGAGVTGSFEEEDAEACSMKETFESSSSGAIC
ncbi:hypothetical protein OIU76_025082 [Salix suchowensis]|nr:hypothetical protein OIU76_025082 [Salix suchowensis]